MAQTYIVGQQFIEGRTAWPEHVEYTFAGQHMIVVAFPGLTDRERTAFAGDVRLALWQPPNAHQFMLAFKFGDLPWADSSFHYYLCNGADDVRPVDPENAETRALFTAFLVEGNGGTLQHIRVFSATSQFTRALHAAIWRQVDAGPVDRAILDREAQTIAGHYTTAQVVKLAQWRSRGGD